MRRCLKAKQTYQEKQIKNRKEKERIRHLLHEARIRIEELVFIKDFELYLVLFLCKGVLTAPFWL